MSVPRKKQPDPDRVKSNSSAVPLPYGGGTHVQVAHIERRDNDDLLDPEAIPDFEPVDQYLKKRF